MRSTTIIGALCLGLILVSSTGGTATLPQLFTMRVEITFDVEEVNIPGWEEGIHSEPVGTGSLEVRMTFPAAGGPADMHIGEVRFSSYSCQGSAPCSCTAPPTLFSKLWSPVVFDRLEWDPESRQISIMGPVTFPKYEETITVRCSGSPPVKIPEYPLYKLLGSFTEENTRRWDRQFIIPLQGPGPWKKTFEKEFYNQGPKVFIARLAFVIESNEGLPPGEEVP